MQEIYTVEQWKQDGTFRAYPGQGIEERIYNEMKSRCKPLPLPLQKVKQAAHEYHIFVYDGYLMGKKCGSGYPAFGVKGGYLDTHYYYLGLAEAETR